MQIPRPPLIPVIVAVPAFLTNLDAFSLTTALPTIAHALDVEPLKLNLGIIVYLLCMALFIPLGGWSADRFGARRTFVTAILIFAVGAAICGLSTSFEQFIAGRVVEGFGGALMTPVGRLIVLRSSAKAELMRAMMWSSAPILLGPVVGPPLAGLIVTYWSWPWIFLLNVPLCVLAAILVATFVTEAEPGQPKSLNILSFLLVGATLCLTMIGFDTAARGDLSLPLSLAIVAVGLLCGCAFLLHARAIDNPIVDVTLLKLKTFRTMFVGGMFLRVLIGAAPFLMPLLLQLGFGLSAFEAGMITFATGIGSVAARGLLQYAVKFFGFKAVLIGGAFVNAALFAVPGLFTPETPHLLIILLLVISGVCRSLQLVAFGVLGFDEIERPRMSAATTLQTAGQQLAPTIAVALSAALLHVTLETRGATVFGPDDFWPTFAVLGALSLFSVFFLVGLPANAGADLGGKRGRA